MARTISNTSGPVVLAAKDDPLSITSSGKVIASNAGTDAIDGGSGTRWTINNAGTISSASRFGVSFTGFGTVNNSGAISGTDAVYLQAGGIVTNNPNATISGSSNGIRVTHGTGTVTNDGSVSGPGIIAVTLDGGGSVKNTGSLVGGEDGVRIMGALGTVTNSGLIKATVDDGIGIFAGGTVTNNAGGTITGAGPGGAGIFITGGSGTVKNSGSIADPDHLGILLSSGDVTNATSGSISGSIAAVSINQGFGTLTNDGSVISTAAGGAGVDFEAGGRVTNTGHGSVSGGNFGIFIGGGNGTVTNSGKIDGATYDGVILVRGGSVANQAGGTISGGGSGVYLAVAASVTNGGTLSGKGTGADFEGGGTFTNDPGGSVSGGDFGIFATGGTGDVTNNGSITGVHGVGLQAGGSVKNTANGLIKGGVAGVLIQGGRATLTNAGAISAASQGGAGADIEGGGDITNDGGSSLSGSAYGVFLTGGSGTVTNAGSISGSVYSVKFSDTGTNRLVVKSSATFLGAVGGGTAASSTMELAGGTGSIAGLSNGSGTVTQNGQSWLFTQFGSLVFDAGSNWTLDGADTASNIGNNGALEIRQSLTITAAIDGTSTGSFKIDDAATLEVASVLGSGTHMQFLSNSKLVVDHAGSFGTGIASASYAGPLLEGFNSGDTVDIKDFSTAGSTFTYDTATGILQLSNSASQAADLRFQSSSLGSGAFHVAGDGGSGSLITRV